MVVRMHDLSIPYLIIEWLRQDPIRALGLVGLGCIAISTLTSVDPLASLGLVEVEEQGERDNSVA